MDELETFVTFSIDTSIVRIVESTFIPSVLKITASIARSEDATDDSLELSLIKIKYWFENVVSNTVAFSGSNAIAIAMLVDERGVNRSGNSFLITPETPSDEVLATVFQAKMMALSGGALFVETISIDSDNMSNLNFTLAGNHASLLPAKMEEWMGTPNYFDVPWWFRDDASTLDVVPAEGSNLTSIPAWSYKLDFLGKSMSQDTSMGSVLRPEFKPTIIDGGKDDKDD